MKKVLLVFLLSIMLTGCTVVRINTESIDNIISVVLSKNNDLYNRIGKGYKYYVPRGVSYIDTSDFNEKLYSNGNYYYLYIDAINYYYQKEINYIEKKDKYYSKAIDKNGKKEAMVDKNAINEVVLNATYILSTIKFNDDVIALNLTTDYFTNQEEVYDIFTTDKKTDNYNKLESADMPENEEE